MERTPTEWEVHYRESRQTGVELGWPSETLVRLIKGDYLPYKPKDTANLSVIDLGFGNCNNTLFLAQAGLRVAGCEVSEDICEAGRAKMAKYGFAADFRVGTNRQIPFESDSFDFLVSWNVLHYEGEEANIRAALREYCRVLKPGGIVLVSTTGPEHKILAGSRTLGNHRYEINLDGDFRKGSVHFLMDAPNYVHQYFDEVFSDVLVGRTHDEMLTATLDWWIISARKA